MRQARSGFVVLMVALSAVVGAGIAMAAGSGKWWRDNLGGPDSSHYVDLDQINKSNVSQLEVAWFYPYGTTVFNPIVVNDMIYGFGRNGSLIGLDAATGKEIWIHEGLTGLNPRGVNYWQSENGQDRRLFFSINSFLQAIDARTGKSILSFGKNGIVDLREGLARGAGTQRIQSNSPGKVFKNLLIMGSAPGEAWISPPGDIRAYDVLTGRLVWQFHTIPLPGEFGYETWPKDAYQYVGGANNWGEMSVDEERGIVYVPTGSPTYDFYGADRHGANLFGNCLLALDARTGKRLWHFQTIHHDLWDLDNVSAPQLVTVRQNGRTIPAVAHAGKTGFLYVFNRVTGEPLWPIEERPVPQTDVPGEYSHPTQPFPTKPAPFARQRFTVDDVNPWLLTPEEQTAMRERVAKARNGTGPQGGIFIPPALNQESISMPGNQGGSNWGTTASNPDKALVYVLNVDAVAILKLEDVRTRAGGRGGGGGASQAGAAVYQQNCQVCHGPNMEGGAGVPSLIGVANRLAEDVIRAIVTGGQGMMRPVPLQPNELNAIVDLLAGTGARGGGPGRGNPAPVGPPPPPGPVVGSGGAPQSPMPARGGGPFYAGNGGNGGNALYPADIEAPPQRYVSDYGVLSSATKPPYATLTAYDLNKGEIKWQIAPGDDPGTLARGGPAGTGGINLRNGIVPTKSGLIFLTGGDRKLRAYDEDTGKVLWTSKEFAGGSRGVPAVYESHGRQYVLITSDPAGARGVDPVTGQVPSDMPRGYIAYALPKR